MVRWIVLGMTLLLFVSCSCQREPDATARKPEAAAPATDAPTAAQIAESEAAQALALKYARALQDAASTVHSYLGELSGGRREEADKRWAYHRLPQGNEEADLRSLTDLLALQIRNDEPKALDKEPVPESIEVPVNLRASFKNGEVRRYTGWYRLRRSPVSDSSWELTSVSLSVVLQ